MSVTITIELTDAEERYFTQCCIGRVAKSAIAAVPADYEHLGDLKDLEQIVEPVRYRICNAIFGARMKT